MLIAITRIIVTFLQHVSFNNLIKAYYNKKLFITKHEYLGRPQMINRTSNYASANVNNFGPCHSLFLPMLK